MTRFGADLMRRYNINARLAVFIDDDGLTSNRGAEKFGKLIEEDGAPGASTKLIGFRIGGVESNKALLFTLVINGDAAKTYTGKTN